MRNVGFLMKRLNLFLFTQLLLTQEELSSCKEEVKVKVVQHEEEEKLRKDMENELVVLQDKLQRTEADM